MRRVFGRALRGVEFPDASVSRAERDLATSVLPEDEATAATWAVAVMELGALVCSAAKPRCSDCPVADQCAWQAAGRPSYEGPPRRSQAWAGTDRQCRGRLMAVLRDAEGPVHRRRLDAVWPDQEQRERCIQTLIGDGLVTQAAADRFVL